SKTPFSHGTPLGADDRAGRGRAVRPGGVRASPARLPAGTRRVRAGTPGGVRSGLPGDGVFAACDHRSAEAAVGVPHHQIDFGGVPLLGRRRSPASASRPYMPVTPAKPAAAWDARGTAAGRPERG